MTVPADQIIAQNMIMYKKTTPPGGQPTIFTVSCNCASSVKERTARFVSANRHLFCTAEQFKNGEWS